MTANQLREAIGQVDASGTPFGVLRMDRPRKPYDRDRVELVPWVYGEQIGAIADQAILVRVSLAGLRRMLSLVNLAAAPPQGTV